MMEVQADRIVLRALTTFQRLLVCIIPRLEPSLPSTDILRLLTTMSVIPSTALFGPRHTNTPNLADPLRLSVRTEAVFPLTYGRPIWSPGVESNHRPPPYQRGRLPAGVPGSNFWLGRKVTIPRLLLQRQASRPLDDSPILLCSEYGCGRRDRTFIAGFRAQHPTVERPRNILVAPPGFEPGSSP